MNTASKINCRKFSDSQWTRRSLPMHLTQFLFLFAFLLILPLFMAQSVGSTQFAHASFLFRFVWNVYAIGREPFILNVPFDELRADLWSNLFHFISLAISWIIFTVDRNYLLTSSMCSQQIPNENWAQVFDTRRISALCFFSTFFQFWKGNFSICIGVGSR